jgi:hypothetical protein
MSIVIEPDDESGRRDSRAADEARVEALRHMPVGTNDPNIVGDVGPTDVPPGTDPPQPGGLALGTSEGSGDQAD